MKFSVFAGIILLGVVCQLSRWPDVFVGGRIFFLDPDCYSRMTRVAEIGRGGLHSIRWHGFENAPEGVFPHTTMPVDALIAGLAFVGGGEDGRDLAGALVSPLLGLAFLSVCAWGLWRQRHGWAGLLLAAVSPILAHAFSVGRPDHQSLAVFLVVLAFLLGQRGRVVCAAAAWGLACWVTLFEPPIILGLVLVGWWLSGGKMTFGKGWWRAPLVFVCVLGFGTLVDGLRGGLPSREVRELFPGWASTIGELRPAGVSTLAGWLGWAGMVAPALFVAAAIRHKSRKPLGGAFVLAALVVLAVATSRWGYFLAAATALALPSALEVFARPWIARTIAILSLWPIAAAWDHQVFPEGEALARKVEERKENLLLHEIATEIKAGSPGTILAPWWLSPALAYWTGFPCVAGSSHQSLPGTADSARFFLGEGEPADILARRGVAYVVSDDPSRVVSTSAAILSRKYPQAEFAARLARGHPPAYLSPYAGNAFFRVYLFRPPVGGQGIPSGK